MHVTWACFIKVKNLFIENCCWFVYIIKALTRYMVLARFFFFWGLVLVERRKWGNKHLNKFIWLNITLLKLPLNSLIVSLLEYVYFMNYDSLLYELTLILKHSLTYMYFESYSSHEIIILCINNYQSPIFRSRKKLFFQSRNRNLNHERILK